VGPGDRGDFSDIQPCIDISTDKDTCYVLPGTYRENIRLKGKQMLLSSTDGPDVTILDGSLKGPVVRFVDYETRNTVLSGFTIVNGKASYIEPTDPEPSQDPVASQEPGEEHGGGIRIQAASPVIENCIIRDNTADGNGGGVYCAFTGAQPSFDRVVFFNNTAEGQGGGLYVFSGIIEVINCLFVNNTAETGGGISAEFGAQVSMNNSTLADNATATGSGAEAFRLFNSSATWTDSILGHKVWEETPAVPQVVLSLDRQQPSPGIPPEISLTMDHVNLEGGTAGIRYQEDCETEPGVCLPVDLDPVVGDPLFVTLAEMEEEQEQEEDNPAQEYYLSQFGGGQSQNSPCLDAGSTTAEAAGLDTLTTQNGENGQQLPDEGTVDLGYHYTIVLP